MKAIVIEKLSKTYRGESKAAVKDLCFEVPQGSIFGFLGPNGAGKTTTISILTGLMKASAGHAFVAGNKVSTNSKKLKSCIGYLGQEPALYKWMKGFELLDFTGEIFGLSKHERQKRAMYLLELSGLKDAAGKKISAYSGGMLQRLGIAQAIMGKPKVLFLDEPTSSLDPIGRKEVLEFIQTLAEECTVFMSSHILTDIERVCTDIAIINHGELLMRGSTSEMKMNYSSGKVEIDFENISDANLFYEKYKNNLKGNVQLISNTLVYHPRNRNEENLKIVSLIHDGQFIIKRLEWTTASLEDIFVSLVENKL